MPDATWVLAHTDPEGFHAIYLRLLASFSSFGLFVSALWAFRSVLLFSLVVLALGRFAKWPPAHLVLPLLGWSFKMSIDGIRWLDPGMVLETASPLIRNVLEGAVALGAIVLLLAIAAGFQTPGRVGRLDGLSWISGLLAVATVFIEWSCFLLFAVPW